MSLNDLIRPVTEPVGMFWCLLVLWMFWRLWWRKWLSALATAGVVVILGVLGNAELSSSLLASLERPYAGRTIDQLPPADAVVMLGGTVRLSRNDCFGFEFNDAADRIITAAELIRRGKARTLILGGAEHGLAPNRITESELLQRWLGAWNVAPVPIIGLTACHTTRDEGERVQRLLEEKGWKTVILVTSAAHMRRGEAIFRRLGINVVCFAGDFRGVAAAEARGRLTIIPTADALEDFAGYTHEFIGWWVYRMRGWV